MRIDAFNLLVKRGVTCCLYTVVFILCTDVWCGGVPERSKGADCKSAGSAFGGSNPPPSTLVVVVDCKVEEIQFKNFGYYVTVFHNSLKRLRV